ncbi:arylamine N-acetyltransferase [Alteribacillus sp. HJP-4]|uniref:arylamine N-acetyltransferase n=1 Tax=Alteribacillus sp. HJP-4 TaxID=2775394 RepID=UPI0035CCE4F9
MRSTSLPYWVQDYLSYINVPMKDPSYEYLKEICAAHLNNIPFENISTLLQYRDYQSMGWYIPNERQFVQQLTQFHMGGTCYAINSNLYSLLKHLGFQCRYTKLGSIHLGLLVQKPDTEELVYVDCGTAAPLFKPLKFETHPSTPASFGGIDVFIKPEDEQDIYTFQRYIDGKLIKETLWSFNINKNYHFDDFEQPIVEYFQPGTLFMNTLRCQIWQQKKQRSLSLVNHTLNIRYINGELEKKKLNNINDIRSVINEEFQLPNLPVEKAIDVLQELEVDIFQNPRKEHRVNIG